MLLQLFKMVLRAFMVVWKSGYDYDAPHLVFYGLSTFFRRSFDVLSRSFDVLSTFFRRSFEVLSTFFRRSFDILLRRRNILASVHIIRYTRGSKAANRPCTCIFCGIHSMVTFWTFLSILVDNSSSRNTQEATVV